MSVNDTPPDKGKESKASGREVRTNPLFANTGGEKRKIRPPDTDPTTLVGEQQTQMATEQESHVEATAPTSPRRKPPQQREMGEVRFDEFYTKKTMHFIPELLTLFDNLARKQHKSKTRLFNEAIAGILASYDALDEETLAILKEFGIEVQV